MNYTLIHLYMESYCGISPEAIRYYGTLQGAGEHEQLTKVLSEADAAKIAKRDRWAYPGYYDPKRIPKTDRAGAISSRFNSLEELIAAAKKTEDMARLRKKKRD